MKLKITKSDGKARSVPLTILSTFSLLEHKRWLTTFNPKGNAERECYNA
jgi:hypothetical protein